MSPPLLILPLRLFHTNHYIRTVHIYMYTNILPLECMSCKSDDNIYTHPSSIINLMHSTATSDNYT